MTWDAGIDLRCAAIAGYEGSLLCVVAGAGTGKSLALKRKVAKLLEEGELPSSILAVTFTRTAARDLVNDLNSLGIPGCDQVHASTLHSLCFRILNRYEVMEVMGRTPRPLLEFETRYLLLDLPSDLFGQMPDRRKRLKAFEADWARLQHEEPGWPQSDVDRKFRERLLAWLRFHNAMLIGELVPETLRYLRNNPACPERRMYKHILVDEYQDLNRAEQELVRLLAGQPLSDQGTLTVVGDDDQSIYGFKYAHPDGIIQFPALYPGTHTETLIDCRRCPTTVVRIANSFLTEVQAGQPRKLLTEYPPNGPGKVLILQWDSLDDEAEGLASIVAAAIQRGEAAPGKVMILAPRRIIGYKIRDALERLNIPVRSCFYEQALESEEARERFSLLTLLANREDRVALRVLLGIGSPNGRAATYSRLRVHCEGSGESPSYAMVQLAQGSLRLPYAGSLMDRFTAVIGQLDELGSLAPMDLVQRWLPGDMGGVDELRELAEEVASEVDSVRELREELRVRIAQPELPGERDRVYVMSLHKAKGLTADMVVLAGCIEGLIPHVEEDRPLMEQAELLAEQQRLFFVGITRTTRTLILSSATSVLRAEALQMRAKYAGQGYYVPTIASRFLSQLGPNAPAPVRGRAYLLSG